MSKLSPLKIFSIYWTFTLILYAFGPFNWVTYKPILFWTLNILYIVAFLGGWRFSRKVSIGGHKKWDDRDDNDLIKKLNVMIYINLFYEIINLFRIFLFSEFDIVGLIARVISGIKDMGSSYDSFQESIGTLEGANILGGTFITIFNYIWEMWAFSAILLSILYFTKLKFHHKVIALCTIMLEVISYVARGTNIGVFRIVFAILIFYYIKYLKLQSKKENEKKKRSRWKLIVIFLVGVIFTVVLFDKIMKSRGGIAYWQTDWYNVGGIHINKDSIFFKIIPSQFHQLLVSLARYLCSGYYGMSLSLRVPWEPMFGIGHSMVLQNLLKNFIPDISKNSYQIRIESFGWDSYINWHSMYCWFANDLSYFGVIFVMLLFGYIFNKSLHDAIELNNPYAKLIVFYMFLIGIFVPCNNQLAQSTFVLFSFFYVFIKWQMSKRGISFRFCAKRRI
ncbi:MAG: oligosaccharide repeat unit polymerase [Lachnospiraceae bacterium]|nr:oligosaccharide repeat unit polymerase [Lachnospiraceae bacterium]